MVKIEKMKKGVVEMRMRWRGSAAEGVTTKVRRGTRPCYSLQHNFTRKENIRTGKYDLPVRDASAYPVKEKRRKSKA